MKKFLIFIYLVTISFIRFDNNIDKYFEPYLNIKAEALGNTGMVFGEEYGCFYLAPTSMQKYNINNQLSLGLQIPFQDFNKHTHLKCSSFFRTRIGNFSIGYYGTWATNSLPLAYSLEVYNFSMGIGVIYNNESLDLDNKIALLKAHSYNRSYLLTNISAAYKSSIGNFSLSLNNFLSKILNDPSNLLNNLSSKLNLRIGYGKEFEIDYLFDKIQVALEIDNLLMNNVYINKKEKDYTLFRKINIGIEILKNMEEANLLIRTGIKNLFPTFGIGIEILEIFRLEYAFTNRDLGDTWGKDMKLVNLISFEARINNLSKGLNYSK